MGKNFKRTILIDLDGVLNNYNGEYKENYIPPIKKGAKSFLENLHQNFEIKLFTTRNKIVATKWLEDNDIVHFFSDITNIKELAWLYIDDRCLNFNGDYNNLIEQIENFKPWYKK